MLKFLIPLLSFYVLLIILVYLIQDKLIFFPDKTPLATCSSPNLISKSVEFNGQKLNFYIRENKNATSWLIHFHGNAGRACDRDFIIEELVNLPLNIVLMEYPGYAGDNTKPSQTVFLKNATAALNYFIAQKEMPIFLFGESLGTGIATYLASKFKVKGLILQSPYPSLGEVGEKSYPFLPIRLLLRNNFPAKEWALQVNTKVLILHGEFDTIIPLSLGKAQGKNFKTTPELKVFKGKGHNDLINSNLELWDIVKSFIQRI